MNHEFGHRKTALSMCLALYHMVLIEQMLPIPFTKLTPAIHLTKQCFNMSIETGDGKNLSDNLLQKQNLSLEAEYHYLQH